MGGGGAASISFAARIPDSSAPWIHAWYGDRWARGAFALFAPDQQSQLQSAIVRPEGRVFFAGEHCSLYHAWIQGALESGIRAANEVDEVPGPEPAGG